MKYYGGVTFLFHPEFLWSNRHLSQKTIGSYICKSWDEVPYFSLPSCHVIITVSIFATPWCWWPLAPTGTIATASPNPSTKTSSRGLRQCPPCLVWSDSCGGVSNSIELSLVQIFTFYFSAVPPLHPLCPAWVDHWRVPSPSRFTSHLSILPWRHFCTALAMPVLVRHHHPLVLALSMLSLYPYCCHCHLPPRYSYLLAIAANISLHRTHPLLPSLPTLMPTSWQ